ncbi:glutamate-rich protein 2 isoform X2 [Aplysia californica]|uniref:Glutamate-rich protein 2 isoform X2 n=1 Tax=Aplysia californica TaxID=6500 RepID=A0ABM0JXK8_APLCA|nr:glutamate-rich protein 2 isoform X2 [Aplysia californica]
MKILHKCNKKYNRGVVVTVTMEKSYQWDKNDRNTSNSAAKCSTPQGRKLIQQSGSLEIIDGNVYGSKQQSSGNSRPPSQSSDRSWSRASVGSIPPRSDSSLSKRTLTPTKQISLQAVRRKEESTEPFVDHVDWRSLTQDSSHRAAWSDPSTEIEDQSQRLGKLKLPKHREDDETAVMENGDEEVEASAASKVMTAKEMNAEEKEEDDKETESTDEDDDEDEDDEDDESEKKKLRAPNELLMEFVDCLMKKDFKVADKLCKMILLYEPENAEALKFKPLIEEKIQLDAEAENEESDDDDDDDSDEDDSDDDSDDDDSSSSEDSDDDDDEDGNNNEAAGNDPVKVGSSERSTSDPRARQNDPSQRPWAFTLRDPNLPSSSKN